MSVVGKVHQLLRRGFPGAPDRELVVLNGNVGAHVHRHIVGIHEGWHGAGQLVATHIKHLGLRSQGSPLVLIFRSSELLQPLNAQRIDLRQGEHAAGAKVVWHRPCQLIEADVEDAQLPEHARDLRQGTRELVVGHLQQRQLGQQRQNLRERPPEGVLGQLQVAQGGAVDGGGGRAVRPQHRQPRQPVLAHVQRLQRRVQCQAGRHRSGEVVRHQVAVAQEGAVAQPGGNGTRQEVVPQVQYLQLSGGAQGGGDGPAQARRKCAQHPQRGIGRKHIRYAARQLVEL
mmetsp:Transcript_12695/g.38275  ORF Transcript_12695/g.38275 Transcript_12695/m.38275 type:complete len:286 (-) Transcript_12695:1950-2807(-)